MRARLAIVLAGSVALAACGGGQPSSTASAPAATLASGDAVAMTALVRDWYSRPGPSVCDGLSDRLLRRGWGKSGEAGREACRAALLAAKPREDVTVSPAVARGARASVDVSYLRGGAQETDEVTFVHRGGRWLADAVTRIT